jgi:organic radical activating enzyme
MATQKRNAILIPNINDVFLSWQGEGMYMGRRAIFVRFAGCNMRDVAGRFCSFCDTPYAFSPHNSKVVDLEELYSTVKTQSKARVIVFTGGEPLMYPDSLSELIAAFDGEFGIQIETNGSLPFDFKYSEMNLSRPVVFSISPKFPPAVDHIYPLRIFESIYSLSSMAYLKFVVTKNDIKRTETNILTIMDRYSIMPHDIWLMPEGTSKATLDTNMFAVEKLANRYDFNISPRLQVEYNFK